MNRLALAAALLLAQAPPSAAHCFSVWHYRFPQHCGAVAVVERRQDIPLPPMDPDMSGRNLTDDEAHALGIVKLKALLKP